MANGGISHNELFLLLPQYVQVFYKTKPLYVADMFPHFYVYDFKIVCCRCVVCGKELTGTLTCHKDQGPVPPFLLSANRHVDKRNK